MNGMGSHQSASMQTDEWLTPPEIIESLGEFWLDPCSPVIRPWNTAIVHLNKYQDGLSFDWGGRVWLNPPYGKEATKWLEKLANHGNGIALIFARTETEMFFNQVWKRADAILFIKGRLNFYFVDGTKSKINAGAPSCLIAYGKQNIISLEKSGIEGKLIYL